MARGIIVIPHIPDGERLARDRMVGKGRDGIMEQNARVIHGLERARKWLPVPIGDADQIDTSDESHRRQVIAGGLPDSRG